MPTTTLCYVSFTLLPTWLNGSINGRIWIGHRTQYRQFMWQRCRRSIRPWCQRLFHTGNLQERVYFRKMKNHTCDVCSKRFNFSSHLKRHVMTHEKSQHKCRKCFRKFSRIDHFQHHVSSCGEKPGRTTGASNLFSCSNCDKSFIHGVVVAFTKGTACGNAIPF